MPYARFGGCRHKIFNEILKVNIKMTMSMELEI